MFWIVFFGCRNNSIVQCENVEDAQRCLQSILQNASNIEEARTMCAQASNEKIRGECFFLVSDGYQLTGEQAMSMCAQADPFTEDCLRHAAARDVEQNIFSTLTHASPQPMKLLPRIHGSVQQYLPAQIAESMSRDMMIRFQASKVGDIFDRDACIGLNPSICAQVYIVASLGSRDQWSEYVEEPWMQDCGVPLTASSAESWGWKDWKPSMEVIVQRAYGQLCGAVQGQNLQDQTVPDARTDSSK